jgi:hypothetical protein
MKPWYRSHGNSIAHHLLLTVSMRMLAELSWGRAPVLSSCIGSAFLHSLPRPFSHAVPGCVGSISSPGCFFTVLLYIACPPALLCAVNCVSSASFLSLPSLRCQALLPPFTASPTRPPVQCQATSKVPRCQAAFAALLKICPSRFVGSAVLHATCPTSPTPELPVAAGH